MRGIQGVEVDSEAGVAGFYVACRLIVIDLADFERIRSLGPGARWVVLSSSRGRSKVPGLLHPAYGRMVVARLIVGARDDERLTYRNGEPFDLRRGNQIVSDGLARFPRRHALPELPR